GAKGRVVNLINAKSFMAFVGGGYRLSKWGVEAFSDTLRVSWAGCTSYLPIYNPFYFALMLQNNLSWVIPGSNHITRDTHNFTKLS
uniref:Uncharacterized protein n=1 Tax=Otus sunia TaxID=257818 RepID=A0A8C8ABQ7_9STRI